ncbi:polyprenal reductase-like [Anticarsia gemmatalis]|uniref:polyprenal reductase-like n=1 Tax=Anticarsia gemmatalis TaxID=129554 RepID=UPI003F75E17E
MCLHAFDVTLIFFTVFITFIGCWLNYYEKHVPAVVHKAAFYGQIGYKGDDANCLNFIEIPKSSFRQMYMYACALCWTCLGYMVMVHFFDNNVHWLVREIVDWVMENQQPVSVMASLLAMIMLTIQCTRRLHETLFLQVFSEGSVMNVIHFAMGIVHYTISVFSIIGSSPLFCGSLSRKDIIWTDKQTFVVLVPSICLFLWASYEQHKSNVILANLRKSKEVENVVTDEYKVPYGRLFNFISSPHRLTEIAVYLSLALVMQTKTYFFLFVWVFSNQLQGAIGTHTWYLKTFSSYPTRRFALIPGFV